MRDLAVSLTDAILYNYENEISSLRLVPSDGGRFEVSVNDQRVFSRIESGQRAEVEGIMNRIREMRKTL